MSDDFPDLDLDLDLDKGRARGEGAAASVAAARADQGRRIEPGTAIRLIIGLVIAALFITFAIQNGSSVQVEFLSWDFSIRLFFVMVLSAAAGIAIWEFAGAYSRRAKRRAEKQEK